jgi:hypothetical protein
MSDVMRRVCESETPGPGVARIGLRRLAAALEVDVHVDPDLPVPWVADEVGVVMRPVEQPDQDLLLARGILACLDLRRAG